MIQNVTRKTRHPEAEFPMYPVTLGWCLPFILYPFVYTRSCNLNLNFLVTATQHLSSARCERMKINDPNFADLKKKQKKTI